MQYSDQFLTLAELGIAMTGFMGIVVTLRAGSISGLDPVSRARVRNLLLAPLGVMFFSLLPSITTGLVERDILAWQISQMLFALYHLAVPMLYFTSVRRADITTWEIVATILVVPLWVAQLGTALGFFVVFIEEVYLITLVWLLLMAIFDFAELLFYKEQSRDTTADHTDLAPADEEAEV